MQKPYPLHRIREILDSSIGEYPYPLMQIKLLGVIAMLMFNDAIRKEEKK